MQEFDLKIKNKKLEPRRVTRCHIFNIIFQLEFLEEDTIFDRAQNYYEILSIEEQIEIEQNEKYVPYSINKSIIFSYITEIFENLSLIDEKIKKYSIGWETSRISKVDLAILRLAIYEIIFRKDIPNKVAINEAIELAKSYSLENSSRFINGILGNVVKEYELQENFNIKDENLNEE